MSVPATSHLPESSANPVWEAYETARPTGTHLRCWAGGGYEAHTWDDWRGGAERAAVGLRGLGVEPGVRVAAVLTNTFEVCTAVVGTWLAGGTLLSLPLMRRGQSAEDYVAQLRRLCVQTGAHLLLLEERFLSLLGEHDLGARVVGFDALDADGTLEPAPVGDDDIAFVQYSSGSTSEPKGCMLSMRAIGEQQRMLAQRLMLDEDSRGVMWLPLSHDMGLFGCVLASWTAGMQLAIGTPERFLRKPHTWMEDCVEFGATITVAPNFGLGLATRRARSRPPSGAIPMRTVVLGAERIEWPTLAEAHEVLGPYGITMDTLTPAYGLAEATLAVAMKPYGAPPHTISIDSAAAQTGELLVRGAAGPGSRELVSCGPPVDGASVRIEGDTGIGRICIRSTALAAGYLDDAEATGQRFVDDELVTGDLGFMHQGELHVLGRADDVISVAGRNVYARDVELAIERIDGVRPGCTTLIDLDDADGVRLAVVAEPLPDAADLPALARELAAASYRAADVRVHECIFIRPGLLPKTPSGKIQRFRCRTLVQAHTDAVLERVTL